MVFDGRLGTGHGPLEQLNRLRRPESVWLFHFAGESLVNYPSAGSRETLRYFNWTVGYNRGIYDESVNFWLRDSNITAYLEVDGTSAEAHKERTESVLFMASNCRDSVGRLAIVRELQQTHGIPVHSFGRCLHNADLPSDIAKIADPVKQKQQLMRRYKFIISIENSLAPDYVTEKLYQPFLAGTVPIYLGAPNVEDYAPRGSFVDLRGAHLAEVATVIHEALTNATAWARFGQWRHSTVERERFGRLMRTANRESLSPCGSCERISQLAVRTPGL